MLKKVWSYISWPAVVAVIWYLWGFHAAMTVGLIGMYVLARFMVNNVQKLATAVKTMREKTGQAMDLQEISSAEDVLKNIFS